MVEYAELHVISNFTFLRGASHPEELVSRAHELGYRAVAITDECSLSGIVRAHGEAKRCGIQLLIGTEIIMEESLHLILLATDRQSYGEISHLVSRGRRNADKGYYRLCLDDLNNMPTQSCIAIWKADRNASFEQSDQLQSLFPGLLWIGVSLKRDGFDYERLESTGRLSRKSGLPRVACGDVHMHHPARRPVRDTLDAIRLKLPLNEMGYQISSNGDQHLRPLSHIARIYPPGMIEESIRIAALCDFSLDVLRYEYPGCLVPDGYTATTWLRYLVEQGVRKRWPEGESDKVRKQVEMELGLIEELKYEPYFLTVYDIVRFARSKGILCQGRGSAANSTACYCLGITEVDPSRMNLLFERFISRERNEPPDIDVDFEHERREEVIQYIYQKYGRSRAALAATVITYKPRSAIRDVGKVLGFSLDQVDRIAKSIYSWDERKVLNQRLLESGFDPENSRIKLLINLVQQILGFPRHLSQHVGGFVITEGVLSKLVPVENASMAGRTVIQWEKSDLETLGLLKIDVLALGMLSAIRKCFEYIQGYRGAAYSMASIPREDPAVYQMIQRADTVGVFQIESRAQMSMLPRLKPASYYDLVIEIALVRPGPIQGDMVHPYLRNRNNPEQVSYPSEALREVLERTLGVPIFQEQVMRIAMVAAGFSPGEADQLRRSMAAWKKRGGLEIYRDKLINGMLARGYAPEFAEQVFNQIRGFGDYGFPESHSASFALLAYVSSWLKHYEPAAFLCALLNSQPMGFYQPAQLVHDAVRHGVEVRPVDINESLWDCRLETSRTSRPAVRLGFRMVKGLSKPVAEKIIRYRDNSRFSNLQDLVHRCGIDRKNLSSLAEANALLEISGHRHRAYWDAAGTEPSAGWFSHMMSSPVFNEATPMLPVPGKWDETLSDYASTGLTLGNHPVALLRGQLNEIGILPASALGDQKEGRFVSVTGLVINRQRPMTASGVVFMTLEDETGQVNIVIWPKLAEQQRTALMRSRLITVKGKLQTESNVIHLIARELLNCNHMIGHLETRSRDFH